MKAPLAFAIIFVFFGALLGFSLRDSKTSTGLTPFSTTQGTFESSSVDIELPADSREVVEMATESTEEETLPEAAEVVYGQFVGQVIEADGTPAKGGEVGFRKGDYLQDTMVILKFPVDLEGQYHTGKIPVGDCPRGPITSSEAPVESKDYIPLYREDKHSSWQVLENLYDESSIVTVPSNGVISQDFILREGFQVVGNIRLNYPNSTGELAIFPIGSSEAIARIVPKNFPPRTRRKPRFEGDTTTPLDGEFCLENIPTGDYILRFYASKEFIGGEFVPLYVARSLTVGFSDVYLKDILAELEEFECFDPLQIPPAMLENR